MNMILSPFSASVSELKKNPSALLAESEGQAVAILNHNRPTAYLVPAETYELMLSLIEDAEWAEVIESRQAEKSNAVEVSLDEL